MTDPSINFAEGQKVQNSNAIRNTCHHCAIIVSK